MWVNIYADNRPENIKSIIVWASAALFVGYQIVNIFVPNAEMLVYVRILGASAYAVALWIFAKDAWIGLVRKTPKPRDFLITGIWLKFLSDFGQSVNAILYRLSGSAWFLNNELLAPIILISVVAVVLHVCTPGTVEGVVPRRNQYALAIGFGMTVLLVGALVASKPDIKPWLDRTRPYIGDWFHTNGDASLRVEHMLDHG